MSEGSNSPTHWNCLSGRVPRSEIVFVVQVILIFTIVGFCLYNLTVGTDHKDLCISLLSSSIGYILPNPKLKKHDL